MAVGWWVGAVGGCVCLCVCARSPVFTGFSLAFMRSCLCLFSAVFGFLDMVEIYIFSTGHVGRRIYLGAVLYASVGSSLMAESVLVVAFMDRMDDTCLAFSLSLYRALTLAHFLLDGCDAATDCR